jgi:type II secretory pathway component PulK
MKPRRIRGGRGFALVSTLLIIAVLTIMVVAFMQSMRVDRMTSRAYLDRFRAELAAESGANLAVAQIKEAVLDPATGADLRTFTVESFKSPAAPNGKDYSPVLTVSRYQLNGTTGQLDAIRRPLVSTVHGADAFKSDFTNTLKAFYAERAAASGTADLNAGGRIQSEASMTLEGLGLKTYYKVPLLPLASLQGTADGRMGMMVFDEQARLNPALHRSQARTAWGSTAAEVPLSLGGIDTRLLSAGELARFQGMLDVALVPFVFANVFDSPQRAADLKHFFGYYDVANEDVIPAGLPGAGQAKYNLNDLAVNTAYGATPTARAEHIGDLIEAQLPLFKTRDPSLAGQPDTVKRKYLNRIAASIVDYIDTDDAPTQVNGGEPAGQDLFPYVTQVAEQYLWTARTTGSPSTATIQTRFYVQLWNPYTVTVTGSVTFRCFNRICPSFGTALVQPLGDYTATQNNVTLRANEFVVLELPAVSQTFSSPTPTSASPSWNNSPADSGDHTTHSYFQMLWNGQLAHMNRRSPVGPAPASSGMARNSKTLALNALHYQVSALVTQPSTAAPRFVGDPRGSYASNYDWGSTLSSDSAYTGNTRWKGRNRDTVPYTQDFKTTWANRDYMRENPSMGNAPGALGTTPAAVASAYDAANDKKNAPFYIRNASMQSAGELGYVFDPAQADDTGVAPSGGSPPSLFVAGGGRTLRVGQPEFSYWDADGKRAIELLDLFSANPANATTGYPEFKGRININTAPREVLMALFYNIQAGLDEGGYSGGTPPTITAAAAATFADEVIREREKMTAGHGPFRKDSDLRRILPLFFNTSNYQPALGAGVGSGGTDPGVMDRAREEAFAKMVNLVTTQSRAFRIVTVGQALTPAGGVASAVRQETLVELEADASGGTLRMKPRIVYRRML